MGAEATALATTSGPPADFLVGAVGDIAARVLQKAARDVREHPQTLPLWALRIAQHINRGVFGYREAWDALEQAAVDGGASEAWADRVLYRSFADSITIDADPMPLTVLVGGLY